MTAKANAIGQRAAPPCGRVRLPRVTVPALECPYPDCRQRAGIRVRKTRDNGDGSVDRYVSCKGCGRGFVLTVDPSIPAAGITHKAPA